MAGLECGKRPCCTDQSTPEGGKMSFDEFIERNIFAKLESKPVLTLLVIAMLYVLAFVFKLIPR